MIDSLHLDSRGEGPTLVLVHGWGFHSGIWEPLAERLATHFRVVCPDLPGHGHSPLSDPDYDLAAVVDALVAQVGEPAIWVGWSLGSMFALQAAIRHPGQVRGVVAIAGTPCFTTRDDWPHAMPLAVIDRFGEELTADWKVTLRRFLTLQGQGCDPMLLRRVRQVAMGRLPSLAGLRGGLGILRDGDLRAGLSAIRCPMLAINGAKDNLVPLQGAQGWMKTVADARFLVFQDAGHMPFLTYPSEVEQALRGFASDPALRGDGCSDYGAGLPSKTRRSQGAFCA
jgi:pimeloyl-[acyl-carrier protein] methyl ester esterase